MTILIEKLQFNKNGLIPAIAQDVDSKKVLMMAWMNKQSIEETIKTGLATYFSRSRNEIWQKGKTSGNLQKIVTIETDCDFDTILLQVKQVGVACHTGKYSCFFNEIKNFS
jgi:phosphoribosyl-AMP cyclohydrolase / phosphoribosyl-ATP pyrophosphohydrolase